MSRQAIAFGPGGPVFINETGTRQAITAAGLFLDETSGGTGGGAAAAVIEPMRGGGWRRRARPAPIPQQVVDDVEALYRLIYAGRRALAPDVLRPLADLVGFFAESFDGRLPPPEAIDWRRLVEYPDIDLSALTVAADFLSQSRPQPRDDGPMIAGWATVPTPAVIDRAVVTLKRHTAAAARRAQEQDEEDALMAILMVL